MQCDNRVGPDNAFRQDCEALLNDFDAFKSGELDSLTELLTTFQKGSCHFSVSHDVHLVPISQIAGLKREFPIKTYFTRLMKCVRDGVHGGILQGWEHGAGHSIRYIALLENSGGLGFFNPDPTQAEDDEQTALLGESVGPGSSDPGNLHVPETHDDAGGNMTPDLGHLLYNSVGDIENQVHPFLPPAGHLRSIRLESTSPHDAADRGSPSSSESSAVTADNSTCYTTCCSLLNSCWNHDRLWTRMLQIILGAAAIAVPAALMNHSKRSTSDGLVELCTEAVSQGIRFPGCS